jgi:hypothetical protein
MFSNNNAISRPYCGDNVASIVLAVYWPNMAAMASALERK